MKNQEKETNKLVEVPHALKEAMDIRSINLEELSKESKICEKMLQEIIDGKRVMPEYLMKILGKLSGTEYKTWKTIQNNELYNKGFEVGERGIIL